MSDGRWGTIVGQPVFICGGDDTPGERDACPHALHNFPLPSGYGDAHATAQSRLSRGWKSKRCPTCGLYGWIPGRARRDGSDAPDARSPHDDDHRGQQVQAGL